MFRCTKSPPEASFPPTLSGLNMAINAAGQPVDNTTGAPFAFFHDINERTNDVHKEAFHTAMRTEMKRALAEFSITEHYITAKDVLVAEKPLGKHVPVLMTDVSTLKAARDVIVVVGESGQDCGVFAWRLVREKEGLKRGTAVGVASAVREYGEKELKGKEVPAMIFLNPGQLLYSYRENCAKTLMSWNDAARRDKMQAFPDVIDQENKLEGHETASEHVHTFLEEILPALIDTSTRIYFIVLGDAAEHVLTALNKRLDDKLVPPFLSRQIEAVTLVNPQITTPPDQFNAKMKFHLISEGKSWVDSSLPLGEIVASPLVNIRNHADQQTVDSDDDGDDSDEERDDQDGEKKAQEEPPMVVTFSAGKEDDGITETAFDSCMDHVLAWLWTRREEVVDQAALVRRMEEMRFKGENDAKLAAE